MRVSGKRKARTVGAKKPPTKIFHLTVSDTDDAELQGDHASNKTSQISNNTTSFVGFPSRNGPGQPGTRWGTGW